MWWASRLREAVAALMDVCCLFPCWLVGCADFTALLRLALALTLPSRPARLPGALDAAALFSLPRGDSGWAWKL